MSRILLWLFARPTVLSFCQLELKFGLKDTFVVAKCPNC